MTLLRVLDSRAMTRCVAASVIMRSASVFLRAGSLRGLLTSNGTYPRRWAKAKRLFTLDSIRALIGQRNTHEMVSDLPNFPNWCGEDPAAVRLLTCGWSRPARKRFASVERRWPPAVHLHGIMSWRLHLSLKDSISV